MNVVSDIYPKCGVEMKLHRYRDEFGKTYVPVWKCPHWLCGYEVKVQ